MRKLFREEVDNIKFCIIVNEPVDATNWEEMVIILRYKSKFYVIVLQIYFT